MNRSRWVPLCIALVACLAATTLPLGQSQVEGAGGEGTTTQPATQPSEPATQPSAGPTSPSKNRAWISGTLLDASGQPAALTEIRAEKHEPMGMGGGGGGRKVSRTQTDEKGNFVFKELDPGAWTIIAGGQEAGWVYQEFEATAGTETKTGTVQMVKI